MTRGLALLQFLLWAAPLLPHFAIGESTPRSFRLGTDNSSASNLFLRDDEPFLLRAGSIHYVRVHPTLWDDRLQRIAALGLNAITTYVPWNVHQPTITSFDFEQGRSNILEFLRLAKQNQLLVLLRAGPYMCGEWDFGGLPPWLRSLPDLKLRTWNDAYIRYLTWCKMKCLDVVKAGEIANRCL